MPRILRAGVGHPSALALILLVACATHEPAEVARPDDAPVAAPVDATPAPEPQAQERAVAKREDGAVGSPNGRGDAKVELKSAEKLQIIRGGGESGSLGGLVGTKGEAQGIGGLGTRGLGSGGGGASGYGYGGGMSTKAVAAPIGVASTETYESAGVNGWVATAEDPLSTFSVDVDTASWSRVRRQLREGYLPANDMVRVEEFVNYFPYEYAPPHDGSPFAVHFEAAPSPFDPDLVVARVGLQARRVTDETRQPAHLTFLVDTSGSMNGADRIGLVKESLAMLAGELGDGDTVSIVTYAGGSRVVLEPTPATDRATVRAAIDSLQSGGSTAMARGILTAYELADRSFVDGHVNRVIIASDGDANVGPTSPDELVASIRGFAKKGITLTTLGYGTGNYRDHRMEKLADDGDGNYYYIDGRTEARRVLVDRMRSTVEVVAKDTKLQVVWDPSVVSRYRLVGYENRDIADQDFRDDAVDAGEVGAGHQVTAIYELELKPGADAAPGLVQLRWKAPGADARAAERHYALPASGLRPSLAETSRDTRVAVAAAWFAEILRDSEHARSTDLADVASLARSARRAEYVEDGELIELIGTATSLGGNGVASR